MKGVARRPHTHTHLLQRSFKEEREDSTSDSSSCPVACPQCYPILLCYSAMFKGLVHQGTELKKQKKINPAPKHSETELTHYRDITGQNEWLRANIFDSLGITCTATIVLYPALEYQRTDLHVCERLSVRKPIIL